MTLPKRLQERRDELKVEYRKFQYDNEGYISEDEVHGYGCGFNACFDELKPLIERASSLRIIKSFGENMTINQLAKDICGLEQGKQEVNIAQVKEVLACLAVIMAECPLETMECLAKYAQKYED